MYGTKHFAEAVSYTVGERSVWFEVMVETFMDLTEVRMSA